MRPTCGWRDATRLTRQEGLSERMWPAMILSLTLVNVLLPVTAMQAVELLLSMRSFALEGAEWALFEYPVASFLLSKFSEWLESRFRKKKVRPSCRVRHFLQLQRPPHSPPSRQMDDFDRYILSAARVRPSFFLFLPASRRRVSRGAFRFPGT